MRITLPTDGDLVSDGEIALVDLAPTGTTHTLLLDPAFVEGAELVVKIAGPIAPGRSITLDAGTGRFFAGDPSGRVSRLWFLSRANESVRLTRHGIFFHLLGRTP